MCAVLQRYRSLCFIIGMDLSFISLQDAKYALISLKFCTNWGLKMVLSLMPICKMIYFTWKIFIFGFRLTITY